MNLKKKLFSQQSKRIWEKVVDYIIGAAVGAIFGSIFTKSFLQAIIFSLVLTAILIVDIFLSNSVDKKCDILRILNNELKSNNYRSVIRIGHALSRPLHLSGRRLLRNEIGHIIKNACEQLDLNDSILIDDKKYLVGDIKAQTLIDDLGWTSFELKRYDSAKENIINGIKIALEIQNYKLALKGYRHLIGILNYTNDDVALEENVKKANDLIHSQDYENQFENKIDYDHAIAEFEYAYARTIIDSEPKKALEIAERVQNVFKTDTKNDHDRFVKTFDLIGDIYARSDKPANLKKAKDAYFQGIINCERYGRTERLLRIAEDYLSLLITMANSNQTYDLDSWDDIDKQEKSVFEKSIESANCIENHGILSKLNKMHRQYLTARKKHK